ncbi:hypothetical protein J6590_079369 [Homalodisca vitripennis]|nr:hypothetical protein J6590_079369 [Homalodisca vitripennis]
MGTTKPRFNTEGKTPSFNRAENKRARCGARTGAQNFNTSGGISSSTPPLVASSALSLFSTSVGEHRGTVKFHPKSHIVKRSQVNQASRCPAESC